MGVGWETNVILRIYENDAIYICGLCGGLFSIELYTHRLDSNIITLFYAHSFNTIKTNKHYLHTPNNRCERISNRKSYYTRNKTI